ncbi:MAG: bis(5'-nucleosyl)-tetraphosphatase (symmetrical) [Lysobacterales bacterium]|jgi:bis(5'-nucleosyl)-tetraphosphatase (symmetrical)
MSTYLIGDIQGCYEPLQRLLDKINFDPSSDQLWSCGDLVNRGGQSLEVLRLLHQLGPACSVTLGNHDLHLLAADSRFPDGNFRNRELAKILKAPDREALIKWLTTQPLATYSEKFNLLRVHAGVVPQWTCQQTLDRAAEVSAVINSRDYWKFYRSMYGNRPSKWTEQRKGWARLRLITNILTRIRLCRDDGKLALNYTGGPGSQPGGYLPWYRHRHRQTRDVMIAFGHWAALGLRIKKRFMALDSACVWGGELTAICLEDKSIHQVPGLK